VLDRIAERDHSAVTASLARFFEPASVAVIGASARRGSIGGELFRNVIAGDFAGAAYPVNPKGDSVGGVRGYTSVEEIESPVDLAVICVPGDQVLAAAQSALQSGVRALCVISAGFAETGSEGRARQEELVGLVRRYGARLIGPNCLGIASAAPRLNATFARRAFPAGRVAFSSQSGALGLALLEQADARGLGLSAFVSIGNKADVSSNDLLEYGRTILERTPCCCISSPSATRGSSPAWPGVSHGRSRSSPCAAVLRRPGRGCAPVVRASLARRSSTSIRSRARLYSRGESSVLGRILSTAWSARKSASSARCQWIATGSRSAGWRRSAACGDAIGLRQAGLATASACDAAG
jgi:predicted CoA-binding protein